MSQKTLSVSSSPSNSRFPISTHLQYHCRLLEGKPLMSLLPCSTIMIHLITTAMQRAPGSFLVHLALHFQPPASPARASHQPAPARGKNPCFLCDNRSLPVWYLGTCRRRQFLAPTLGHPESYDRRFIHFCFVFVWSLVLMSENPSLLWWLPVWYLKVFASFLRSGAVASTHQQQRKVATYAFPNIQIILL